MQLGALGMGGQVDAMMLHSVDYLDLFSTVVIAWQWLLQAAVAQEKRRERERRPREFYEGKLCAAEYWIKTELPRIDQLARCAAPARARTRRMKRRLVLKLAGDSLTPRVTPRRRSTSFSVTSFRCRKTLCAIDIVGTASSAPGTRKKCSPARSEKMTSTG